jgi:hypothetical protein
LPRHCDEIGDMICPETALKKARHLGTSAVA